MKVDIVIPAYNERDYILSTVNEIRNILRSLGEHDWNIIVAENGSSDGTSEVVATLNDPNVAVLHTGKGKGRALREAFAISRADIIGFFDADLSVDPSVLPIAIQKILDTSADIVVGSRLLISSTVDRGGLRTFSSKMFNVLGRLVLGRTVSDTQCGFKVMNTKGKEVFVTHREDTWFFDVEFLSSASMQGLRIHEVPVVWTEYRYCGRKSKLKLFRDGMSSIAAMVRIRRRIRRRIKK